MTLGISSFAPQIKHEIPPYSDGGIVAPPSNKPIPGACEERNKTFDFKTGEWRYTDQLPKDSNVCWLA